MLSGKHSLSLLFTIIYWPLGYSLMSFKALTSCSYLSLQTWDFLFFPLSSSAWWPLIASLLYPVVPYCPLDQNQTCQYRSQCSWLNCPTLLYPVLGDHESQSCLLCDPANSHNLFCSIFLRVWFLAFRLFCSSLILFFPSFNALFQFCFLFLDGSLLFPIIVVWTRQLILNRRCLFTLHSNTLCSSLSHFESIHLFPYGFVRLLSR